MSPNVIAIAGVCAIGLVAYAFVSARTKRRLSCDKSQRAPTAREELRKIARENDVPDVMPRGVRRANALDTADQLDGGRFHDGGGDGGGDSGDGGDS
jgi:hypothetical protein